MRNAYRLSPSALARLNALYTDPIMTNAVDRAWLRFRDGFDWDEAAIRSVAGEAILNVVAKYPRKPIEEQRYIAISYMRNGLLNALKALNRDRRGGGKVHVQIADEGGGSVVGDSAIVADGGATPEQFVLAQERADLTPVQEALLAEISRRRRKITPRAFLKRALARTGATMDDASRLAETLFS